MTTVQTAPDAQAKSKKRKQILLSALAVYLIGLVIIAVAVPTGEKNEHFNIVEPFHLDTWFEIAGPIKFNKGVLYLLMSTTITLVILTVVAKRMQMRPNRTQAAVEAFYELTRNMTRENMDDKMAKKWFPLIATIFVFILVTNLLGYIPLPVNTAHPFDNGFPSFQLYAADTNAAVPLVLATIVFIAYNVEGFRAHGFMGYIKSLVPSGIGKGMLVMIYPLEVLSHFLRLISLTVRLWANLLAGHLLIDFMAGNLAVLLGMPALGWITLPLGVAIFVFECALIAGLQAFIFSILTAIYLGSAVKHH
jgi:F-type H+-transporting ATPase subunit a